MVKKRDYDNWSKTELIKEVKKLEKRKKYGIVWEDKPEDVAKRCKNELPVLEEDKNKEIVTDKEKPVNILIEGDNYHALSVLNYTHKGKIDVICIDPPYNTGSKNEWKYNDHYVDKEDAYRHSKWISFMEKRLRLAKKLLKRTGIVFISIDDNEIAQLKLLCNEIFWEKNFIEQLVWKNKYGAGAKTKGFISIHEYILCYSNGGVTDIQSSLGESELAKHSKKDEKYSIRGGYRTQPLMTRSLGDRPNLVYPVKYKGKEIWPDKQWVWSKERMEKAIKNNEVEFTQRKDGTYGIRAKQYLKDEQGNIRKGKPLSIVEGFFTQEGTKDIFTLFNKNVFAFPKPKNLLKYLINLDINGKENKKAIILDFFAGSGTTAHAVLELNNEDKGNRRFILCTNNEDNNGDGLKIAEDICYPRINKVIKVLEKESKGKLISNRPGGLKYYKTDFVDAEPTDLNKRKMVDKSTEMLCLKEDCFDEIKKGQHFKIFKNSQDKHLGIIFDDDGIEQLKKEIKKLNKKFIVYVFSLDESAREEEFEDVADLVELKPIPAVILSVYKRIFK
ncbi:MAG: site-specific DNA-methyltransferase [Methanophagales archaeon]|nr:site-specific DNA-methyltransferase [Methanophagales archaeon]